MKVDWSLLETTWITHRFNSFSMFCHWCTFTFSSTVVLELLNILPKDYQLFLPLSFHKCIVQGIKRKREKIEQSKWIIFIGNVFTMLLYLAYKLAVFLVEFSFMKNRAKRSFLSEKNLFLLNFRLYSRSSLESINLPKNNQQVSRAKNFKFTNKWCNLVLACYQCTTKQVQGLKCNLVH